MRAASDGKRPRLVLRGARLQERASCRAVWAPAGANGFYVNPWGSGALCDDHCTKYGSDGYTSCNGVSNPITVWRQASYNPVFDDNYIYKLVNVKLEAWCSTSPGATRARTARSSSGTTTAGRTSTCGSSRSPPASGRSSRSSSGKVVTDRNGSSANVMTNSYNGTSTDNWAIDDHNGHFIIRNKSTNAYLRATDTNGSLADQRHHELQRRRGHRGIGVTRRCRRPPARRRGWRRSFPGRRSGRTSGGRRRRRSRASTRTAAARSVRPAACGWPSAGRRSGVRRSSAGWATKT